LGKNVVRGKLPEAGSAVSRREFIVAGGLLAGATALSACGGTSVGARKSTTGPAKRGGSLTWGTDTDPTFLIPIGADATATWRVTSLMYESLLRWDRNLKVLPALAESWTTPDNRTFIFKLRKDARFHSGKLLDAEDVKYSIDKQRKPPAPGIDMGFFPPIAAVDVIDKHTVRLRMSAPAAPTLGYFAWNRVSSIVPAGFYEHNEARTQADGTGPFKLAEYVPNDHVKLVRNPHYWRPDVPVVDELTIKILPDESARFAALRSGGIDGATFGADTARIARSDNRLQVLKGLTAAYNELEITLKDSSAPWHDARVRQAVNHAIDRQEIIDKVFAGQAVYSGKIAPGYGDWAIPEAQLKSNYQRYDVNKAKALLAAAGHSSGFDLTLISIADPKSYTQVAEVVQEQLKKVNINVTVRPMEIGTFSKHNGAGTFQWESTGRGMRGDPSGFMADFDPKGGLYKAWYQGGWSDPKLTQLINQGISTLDNGKRHKLYRQMEEIVLTQCPVIPLVDQYRFQIVGQRVRGMYVSYADGDPGLAEVSVS
jgi:peptide/nickel transport system substrate-binding protein